MRPRPCHDCAVWVEVASDACEGVRERFIRFRIHLRESALGIEHGPLVAPPKRAVISAIDSLSAATAGDIFHTGHARGGTLAIGIGIVLLAMAAGIAWYSRPAARAARRLLRLEERYFRKVHLPRHLAQESLQRHVARLRERHPGRGPAWYAAQVLADLERDRR
jgi:hypothetical protein